MKKQSEADVEGLALGRVAATASFDLKRKMNRRVESIVSVERAIKSAKRDRRKPWNVAAGRH